MKHGFSGENSSKMDAPLIFTAEGAYNRLSLARNLGIVVTSFARRVQNRAKGEIPEFQKFEIVRITRLPKRI